MSKRFAFVAAIVGIFVLVGAAASVFLRLYAYESAARKAASADFETLGAILAEVRQPSDLSRPALRERLLSHYKRNPGLLLVSVYEKGVGVRWRAPASSPFLPAAENSSPRPRPSYPERSALLLSAPLSGDPSGRLALDALYVLFPQALVFTVLRDAALALAIWLVLALVVGFVSGAVGKREEEASWTARAGTGYGHGPLEAAIPASKDEAARPSGAPGLEPEGVDEEFSIPAMEESPGLPDEGLEDPADMALRLENQEEVSEEPDLPLESEEDEEALKPYLESSSMAGEAEESVPESAAPNPHGAVPHGLYSPSSGLGWEEYLGDRLEAELSRAASFEQDLSLVLVEVGGLSRAPEVYGRVGEAFVEFFSFRDLAFERGPEGFAVILPNVDLDHALRMSEEFLKKLTFLLRGKRDPLDYLPLHIGVSARAGRLVRSERIYEEAKAALQKAEEEKDSHIVAFRPDPDKYRAFLAEKKGC